MSNETVAKVLDIYHAPIGCNASYDTGNFRDDTHVFWEMNDNYLAKCSAPMIARAESRKGAKSYELRFNAPQPGFAPWQSTTHSSDNYYLYNTTASMNETMAAVAHEWRAYLASFTRHSEYVLLTRRCYTCADASPCSPNVEKLETSPTWHPSSGEWRYEPRMVISFSLNSSAQPEYPTNSGMELVDTAEWDRCSYMLSEEFIKESHQ